MQLTPATLQFQSGAKMTESWLKHAQERLNSPAAMERSGISVWRSA
jgi:hypothetical protein